MQGYWSALHQTPAWYNWAGLAFEAICYKHIPQINKALHLSPTALATSWRYIPTQQSQEQGAQIDLLFDRIDDAITICEIKYTDKPFSIDKAYAEKLTTRLNIFKAKIKTNKQIFLSFISANGLKKNLYSEELVDSLVTIEDLFKNIN